jgi:hypothetical protein
MTTLAGVKVVPVAECGCGYTSDPAVHGYLLSIESMPPVQAATVVADLIGNDEHHWTTEAGADEVLLASQSGFREPDDFSRFVARHNWIDPVSMANLAASVEYAARQSLRSRGYD